MLIGQCPSLPGLDVVVAVAVALLDVVVVFVHVLLLVTRIGIRP
jgi:hypothetical protein